MSTEPESTTSSVGRQITLTPVAPGVWLVVGGTIVAALGPLFGFLVGTMTSSTTNPDDLSSIYLFLFGGIAVGGLGVAAALLGARRVVAERRDTAAR